MKKKRKEDGREEVLPSKQKKMFSFSKQNLLGVIGGSGFLLIIKGVGGLIESIFERPSAQWRTDITFGNLFLYLLIVFITLVAIKKVPSKKIQKKNIYQILSVAIVIITFAFILTFTIPILQVTMIRIHPVILVLAGAVLLPASGNLSFRKNKY
ncbi:hypothetical protein LZ578_04255 [Jeotgalibaca sp. MA1X17-3]|uniref:hypothetical protein n=1 Tax=Jeotgalibaca sp. MA1X17-3 TaxID=2908211 RepID=UPI001F279605|nr:hypothetical protein [Jeotgalibaca sp. MA1X17-3]UJF16346.1 hypothetical protein LZ578_04255 [Jeotgalibaca sp. MA1X17-3]